MLAQQHMNPHTMPSEICVAVYIDHPKQRNVGPLCGTDMPLDIIQREFLRHGRVGGSGGSGPFTPSLSPLHLCITAGVIWR